MRRQLSEEIKQERRNELKEKLKGLIVPMIFFLIIAGFVVFIINYQAIEEEPPVIDVRGYTGDEKPVVIENDALKLTMDPLTTNFTLKVKSSGKEWYSSPIGAADDPIANKSEKGKILSPLLLSYSVETGLVNTYDVNTYSVANGIYDIEATDDSITVKYTIGKVEKEYKIPPICPKDEFEALVEKMSASDRKIVKSYYKLYDINNLGKKDNKEELLAAYPYLETEPCYVIRDSVKEKLKREMEKVLDSIGYTYEDFLRHKELGGAMKTDAFVFDVDVTYKLEGDDLVVSVPMSSLIGEDDYPIYDITLLPYFGAGSTEDTGFMLVPEGGGALINFNNGRVSQNNYYANLYGWDMCLMRDAVVHETRANYGVFGISSGNDSFICVLEDGASYAAVQADISGKLNSYNFVNAVYSVKQREQYDVGAIANSSIYKFIDELPDESYVQRYSFVDSGDYVDMANEYGKYLEEKYPESFAMNDDASTPVAVEIVGAIDKVKQIVGVPVSRPLELTTFDEASEIVDTLITEDGMDNISVKLTGWCNGGVSQQLMKNVHVVSDLGGKKDLKKFCEDTKAKGVDLYLNGVTQYEHDSNIFDGFFSFRDAAKYISKERAVLYAYSDITYAQREGTDTYYLLHTSLASDMAANLAAEASKYDTGISYQDLGFELSSDFDSKRFMSREAVKNVQTGILKENQASGQKVMINRGNDFAVPYADMIVNMELRGNDYTILDECVPFYQMAIHGAKNYFGAPLNVCGDINQEILYCAEYGAGLYFTLMKESSFTLQKTLYTEYYGSDFDVWNEKIKEVYARYNSELGHVFNQKMVDHENVTGHVSRTEYADGTKVYVNYGFETATADGVEIPARDYVVVR